MASAYVNLVYQLVFSTKKRHRWIDDSLADRLYAYLGAAIEGEGGHPVKIGGIEDHLRILAHFRQDTALSESIKRIKSGSTGWIHETFSNLQQFAWQEGYSAFTVSQSNVEAVSNYISRQKEHHRKKTFQEEREQLLRLHGIQPDPRFFER